MQLFYSPDLNVTELILDKDESRHVVKVLRKNVGDKLHFTNGKGTLAEAEIIDPNPKACRLGNLQRSTFQPSTPQLTIACAPTKNNDRFEWFLEKTTEIGIHQIIPLLCERSERRVVKEDRLTKVLVSAMKQSQRMWLPQLSPLTAFNDLVTAPFEGNRYIAHCEKTEKNELKDTLNKGKNTLLLIGPEGDFTPDEIRLATSHGFIPVSLGSARLRTETAAIASCVIFNTNN